LRVNFSEDEVSGLGDQSRAASWSAVTVATLLSGAPLEGRYEFEISGPIDGRDLGGPAISTDVGAKFDALSSYWTGFVGSRVLAYLGGFATDGLSASA